MVYSNKKMLIFHTDHTVQIKLEAACRPLGEIQLVQSSDEALEAANIQNFDLLLLQWEFPSDDGMGDIQTIFHLQPQSVKVALVYPPQLSLVVSAIKSGFADILSCQMEEKLLASKLEAFLSLEPRWEKRPAPLSSLVNLQVKRCIDQKTSLAQARRLFFKQFLVLILNKTDLPREALASLLEISPRTLQRYIQLSGQTKRPAKSKSI